MLDHFDLLAPIYERVIPPPDPEPLRSLLKLPTEGALLDAGGGTGRVAGQLKPWVRRLVVSDVSPRMLHQSQQRAGLTPLRSPAERLPFAPGSFERVLVVDALHHFQRQPLAVRELVRVLKPGGRLVIEEPDIHRLLVKGIALAEKLALMGSHFHTAAQIRVMAAGPGLTGHIERNGGFAVWVVIDKK